MAPPSLATVSLWARRGALAGLAAALTVVFLAIWVDVRWGGEVLLIAPYDPSVVALNRSLWTTGEPVAEIYGSAMSARSRVLLFGQREVIHPAEDPSLALLPVHSAGPRPIQTKTLWWAVRLIELGLGAVVTALGIVARVSGRREKAQRRRGAGSVLTPDGDPPATS